MRSLSQKSHWGT